MRRFSMWKCPAMPTAQAGGLVVFRHPGLEHYPRLIEAARSRLADLELDDGVEKSKVDSVRSRLFGALRPYYQERDRLRLLIQYRKDSTRALACGFQRPR
jgi:hypothetical protein